MKKYQVIGGQYEAYNYGESDSLVQAKRIATQNAEYWDNWQGWHIPEVYESADCVEIECYGMITHRDGELLVVPRAGAVPVAYKDGSKWVSGEEWPCY